MNQQPDVKILSTFFIRLAKQMRQERNDEEIKHSLWRTEVGERFKESRR